MKNMKKLLGVLLLGVILLLQAACGEKQAVAGTTTAAQDSVLVATPEVAVWTEKIKASPRDTALYVARYKALTEAELYELAVEDAKTLISLDSTKVAYYRMLSNAYFDANDSRQGIKVMQKAVDRFDKDIYTRLALAEMHMIVQEYEQSRIVLDNILKLEPFNASARYMLGQLAKEQGDTMGALVQFQQVVEQDAEHHDAYIQLGKLCDGLNRPIALQYFDNALRIDSNSMVALMSKAQYYHQRGQFDEALIIYNKGVNAQPLNAEVQYNMGLLYLERADLAAKDKALSADYVERARKHFDTATKCDVLFGEAHYYLGVAFEKQGKISDAVRNYENAIRMGEALGLAQAALDRLKK
jgi:tetratricopeptide (TPR) repeat protein